VRIAYLISVGGRSGEPPGDGAGRPASLRRESRMERQTRERVHGLELEVAKVGELVAPGAVVVIWRLLGSVLGQGRRGDRASAPGPQFLGRTRVPARACLQGMP
jgi:hypothetical protein